MNYSEEIERISGDGTLDFFKRELNARRDCGAIDLLDHPRVNIGLIRILLEIYVAGDTISNLRLKSVRISN